MSHVNKIKAPTKFLRGVAFRKLKDNVSLCCVFYCLLASRPIPKLFWWSLEHKTRWIISNLLKKREFNRTQFVYSHTFSNKIQFKEDHCSKRCKRKKNRKWKESLKKMFELKFLFCNYLSRMFNWDDDLYIHFFFLRFKYINSYIYRFKI